jgi:hypothetical protein
LAIAYNTVSTAFAQSLAKALQMRVLIYARPIEFFPEFTTSPPVVQKRGIVGFHADANSPPNVEDLHKYEGFGIPFDP